MAPVQHAFYTNEPGAAHKARQRSCESGSTEAHKCGGLSAFTSFVQHALDIVVRTPTSLAAVQFPKPWAPNRVDFAHDDL